MDRKRKQIHQGGIPVGFFERGSAIMDIEFFGCAAGRELTRAGIPVLWRIGVANLLKIEAEGKKNKGKHIRVYQLNSGAAPDKKFVPYKRICELHGGVDRADYHLVFDGRIDFTDMDSLYGVLGVDPLPDGFVGRRLSMSDVVEIIGQEDSPLYYVDPEEYILIQWKE